MVGILLLSLAGCSCSPDPATLAAEEAKQKEEEARRQNKIPPFDPVQLDILPQVADQSQREQQKRSNKGKDSLPARDAPDGISSDVELLFGPMAPLRNYVKPRHWSAVQERRKANDEDVPAGELRASVQTSDGDAVPLLDVPYSVTAARPVSLAKGKEKFLDYLLFTPPQSNQFLRTELLSSVGGPTASEEVLSLSSLPQQTYLMLLLSTDRSKYHYWADLDTIRAPATSELRYNYKFSAPAVSKSVPVPRQVQAWTTTGVLVWDNIDPALWNVEQQTALIDWLHWGGVLVINGPSALDKLSGSFLDATPRESYLPLIQHKAAQLTAEQLAELNDYWSRRDDPAGQFGISTPPARETTQLKPLIMVKPWSIVDGQLAAESAYIPNTAEMIAARRVGRGRVVVTKFSLTQPELRNWPGFDGFLNSALLGRGPRAFYEIPGEQFSNQAYAVAAARHDGFLANAYRNSKLRFLSRDWTERGFPEIGLPAGVGSLAEARTAVVTARKIASTAPKERPSENTESTPTVVPRTAADMSELVEEVIEENTTARGAAEDHSELAILPPLTTPLVEENSADALINAVPATTPGNFAPIPARPPGWSGPWPPPGLLQQPQTSGAAALSPEQFDDSRNPLQPAPASWNDYSIVSNVARRALGEAAGIKIPGLQFVVGTLLVYLAILVFVNYGIFRVLGRVEYAWLAAPLIAIGGSVAVIRLAQLDIGFVRSQTEVAILECHANYPRAHLTRYTALYSSLTTSYELTLAESSAVSLPFPTRPANTGNPSNNRAATPVDFWQRDKEHSLNGFLVSSNSMSMAHSEQMLDLGGVIEYEPRAENRWAVRNKTTQILKDAAIVMRREDGVLAGGWIGELRAGEGTTVDLAPLEPSSLNLPLFSGWQKHYLNGADNPDPATTTRITSLSSGEAVKPPRRDKLQEAAASGNNPPPSPVKSSTATGPIVPIQELLGVVSSPATISCNEARLVCLIPQQVGGMSITPATANSEHSITLMVVHLQTGTLWNHLRDYNTRQDVMRPALRSLLDVQLSD
ncbi:MAG: hypothetical protein SFX18_14750 [Pirellulales bacterium]|nr:hypothetical protein [Pirellulales bacterium]